MIGISSMEPAFYGGIAVALWGAKMDSSDDAERQCFLNHLESHGSYVLVL